MFNDTTFSRCFAFLYYYYYFLAVMKVKKTKPADIKSIVKQKALSSCYGELCRCIALTQTLVCEP